VSDIDVSVRSGEVVVIVGPNGAGKSTLLKAVLGAIPVMGGHVRLGSLDVTNLGTEVLVRKGVGYVPQLNDVFETLNVRENLEMGGYLVSREALRVRLDQVLALFPRLEGMQGRTASKLSGGERKMVALGRVLMAQPRVLVLDEPTAGLSPHLSRVVLREHVRRLADDTGVGVLLVEQKAVEALHIGDYAHVLVGGRFVVSGAAGEVLAHDGVRQIFLGGETGKDWPLVKGEEHG